MCLIKNMADKVKGTGSPGAAPVQRNAGSERVLGRGKRPQSSTRSSSTGLSDQSNSGKTVLGA